MGSFTIHMKCGNILVFPKHLEYTSTLALSVLYYSLFYFSLEFGGNVFGQNGGTAVDGILMALGVILIFEFAYCAYNAGKP